MRQRVVDYAVAAAVGAGAGTAPTRAVDAGTRIMGLAQRAAEVGDGQAARRVIADVLEQELSIRRHAIGKLMSGRGRCRSGVHSGANRTSRVARNGSAGVRSVITRGRAAWTRGIVVIGRGTGLNPISVDLVVGTGGAKRRGHGAVGGGDLSVVAGTLVERGEPGLVCIQARV